MGCILPPTKKLYLQAFEKSKELVIYRLSLHYYTYNVILKSVHILAKMSLVFYN